MKKGWIRTLSELPTIPQSLALSLPVLFPAVEVAYDREYFQSFDNQIRLTIDTGIQYRRAGSIARNFTNDTSVICEVKTNVDSDQAALLRTSSLPFRMSRNSKYCSAVSRVCKDIIPAEHWLPYD